VLILFALACQSGPDYGAYGSLIGMQLDTLKKDPCNEKAVIELSGLYERAIHQEEGLTLIRTFVGACQPSEDFELFQLEYAQQASDWQMALVILDRRVAAAPSDPRQLRQRAQVRSKAGDLAGAVHDFRQVTFLESRDALPDALKELAISQEKAGLRCDAWRTWKNLAETSRKLRGEAQLAASKILDDPTCRDQVVTTSSKVTRTDIGRWWVFPVSLDGKAILMGADSSAAVSVVSQDTAAKLGLPVSGDPWFVRSFQGTVAGPMVHVATLQIGTVVVPDVDVVVVESVPDNVPGMMGTDVLSRIHLAEESGVHWKVEPNE
jgi:hypothetical protein